MRNKKLNGFEKRELLGKDYWDDPRWKRVKWLRKIGKMNEANGLVFVIRYEWGCLITNSIKDKKMLLIINEKPVKEEHVSWYVKEESHDTLLLIEVVLCTYQHPQAPKNALIQQYETRYKRKINTNKEKHIAGHVIILESALNVVSQIEKDHSTNSLN